LQILLLTAASAALLINSSTKQNVDTSLSNRFRPELRTLISRLSFNIAIRRTSLKYP